MRAGSGVVLLISSVTKPTHSGSNGVTFTMIPHRAYVDLPRQIVSTFRGIRKYSTDRASANEFGGMMHTSPLNSTNDFGSKCFGSTIVEFTLVKIRNSSATRISYAVFCLKKQITPSRTCRSVKGSIILL